MVEVFMLPRHYSYVCHLFIGFFYDTWLDCVFMVYVFMLPRQYAHVFEQCASYFQSILYIGKLR